MEKADLFAGLNRFFGVFGGGSGRRAAEEFAGLLPQLSGNGLDAGKIAGLRAIYEQAVTIVEGKAASSGYGDELLDLQRNLYRELEHILSFGGRGDRHNFMIVIPVADRPVMLRNCVDSLIEQCGIFRYGGRTTGAGGGPSYPRVSLFIVDDSSETENIRTHMEIAERAAAAGIACSYIGLEEQTAALKRLPSNFRESLGGLIGGFSDRVLPHKGASVSRNIAYICIREILGARRDEKTLVYFLDSDEEFRVRVGGEKSPADISFINYFYWLDRIFSSGGVEVVTGKVVGDPPVTPAVMINTFLDDLLVFFESLSGLAVDDACPFHEKPEAGPFSAEYHDMVGLFGYENNASPRKFVCGLKGSHTAGECFGHFSEKAMGFFYGLHPTRAQYYDHTGDFMKSAQARTVYTGNYVFTREGLSHFIPFADLGLRMAGPTLGRILKSRIGGRFVSANLPLLHKRTVPGGSAEFRAGIRSDEETIDLSLEFCRQFWGDVMLFSVETLAAEGYPLSRIAFPRVAEVVNRTKADLQALYERKIASTDDRIAGIRSFMADSSWKWNDAEQTAGAMERLRRFCSLAEYNFGINSEGFIRLSGQMREGRMINLIIDAIHLLCEDDQAWSGLLEGTASAVSGKT